MLVSINRIRSVKNGIGLRNLQNTVLNKLNKGHRESVNKAGFVYSPHSSSLLSASLCRTAP